MTNAYVVSLPSALSFEIKYWILVLFLPFVYILRMGHNEGDV